jgi:hypothetical protein
VTDPALIVLVAFCARGISQLAGALAQRMVLRVRVELVRTAAAAPPGTEVMEQDRWGGNVGFRVSAPAGAGS